MNLNLFAVVALVAVCVAVNVIAVGGVFILALALLQDRIDRHLEHLEHCWSQSRIGQLESFHFEFEQLVLVLRLRVRLVGIRLGF